MTEINYKIEELLPIVQKLTIKYTSNESSSITYETARTLMSAVIYCINESRYISSAKLNKKKSSFELDKHTKTAREAYEEGYELVIEKVKATLALYNKIMEDFRCYENIAYYDTVVKGMPAFFQYYDAKFNPQNHILTLDYPTIKDVNELCGIDAIYEYLLYISLEQTFLKAFSDDVIIDLLNRFHDHYYDLFINICSIVLQNAIGCLIVGKQVLFLKIEERDYKIIRKFVEQRNQSELEKDISELIHTIIKYGFEDNSSLYEYLLIDVSDFATRLLNAVENNCLETIFGD